MNKCVVSVFAAAVLAVSASAAAEKASGIVGSVNKAPIVPDGDVAGARTDLVIDLALDMDPAVEGLSLEPGDQLRIVLPDAFVADDLLAYPIANVGSSPACVPGNLQCTTGVLLQGWPQNPLPPSGYLFDIVDNVVTYTAVAPLGPNAFGPGLKQAHLITNGFRNPSTPGRYVVDVELRRGKTVSTGRGTVLIRPNPRASINVTSVFDVPADDPNGGNPPNPNFIYQRTGPGTATPLIWNFLLWNTDGGPFTDVEIVQSNAAGGRLARGRRTVGHFRIIAPPGSVGQSLVSLGASVESGTPVIGTTFDPPLRTGRLRAVFTAGSQFGRYEVLLRLNNGNTQRMVVDVVE